MSNNATEMKKELGMGAAMATVVGCVIGSGVFFKAQAILTKTGGDMPLAILAWLIGGAIMLVNLLSFAFMSQKYERVNGMVDYAEATVGKRYGYMMGWFVATIYFPAMTAALAWLSARYTLEFITSVNPNFPLLIPAAEGGCVVGPECMALTLFYMVMSYVINTRAILSGVHYEDGVAIRRCAIENGITMLTSLDTVKVLLDVLEETTLTISTIDA